MDNEKSFTTVLSQKQQRRVYRNVQNKMLSTDFGRTRTVFWCESLLFVCAASAPQHKTQLLFLQTSEARLKRAAHSPETQLALAF